MAEESQQFQPGAILHEAILGAFKARGSGFDAWCTENNVTPSAARNSTFGQMRGPKGRALLARLIDAAGAEMVEVAYRQRMAQHLATRQRGAA